ncbi:MAG: DUF3857 domain-containing protein [Phycisphaerae bacterium]
MHELIKRMRPHLLRTVAPGAFAGKWSWPAFNARVASLMVFALACCATTTFASQDDPPIAWHAELADFGDSEAYPKADAFVALHDVSVHVGEDGLATTYETRVVKLLTSKGVRDHAVARFDFDPNTNRFQVKAIRIHRMHASGTAVLPVDLAPIVTAPAPARSIYWGSMFQAVEVPGLKKNDVLEIVTEKTGFNLAYLTGNSPGPVVGAETLEPPMPGHWHDTVYFQEQMPIREKRYTVRVPRNKPLQYEVCHGSLDTSVRFDGSDMIYRFVGRDMSVPVTEPRRQAFSDVACKLVLTTVEDWVAKSQWFHDANVYQFDSTPAIEAKVSELIRDVQEPVEKMRRINSWVADNVRYVGTARGPCEGYTMHRSDETFRDLGGVCKDKAGLAVTMLRVAGFDAFPVMTQAGSDVEYTPADQFNHAVAAVREKDGGITLLDPTWSPTSRELWSSRECLQYVVYGFPGGRDLGQSPYFPPAHNNIESTTESSLDENGTLTMRTKFELSNYPCTSFRRFMARHAPRDRHGQLESAFDQLGRQVHLKSASYTEPRNYEDDSQIRANIQVDNYALHGKSTFIFKLPMLQHPLADIWCGDILQKVDENDDRRTGMKLRTTRRISYKDTLQLPEGWKIADMPDSVSLENDAGLLQFDIRQEEEKVHYELLFEARQHIIPAENYKDYQTINAKLLALADLWISCSPKRPSPSPMDDENTPGEEATR